MPGQLHELSAAIGALQADVKHLSRDVRENQEIATDEHRKVHEIVDATAEAVRNLTKVVAEMKPLTDDYRERRAESRGRAHLARTLYVMIGSVGGAIAARAMEIFGASPPHH